MNELLLHIINKRYLETTLAKKLIPSSERNLNNTCEFSQLFRSVSFDVCDALILRSVSLCGLMNIKDILQNRL